MVVLTVHRRTPSALRACRLVRPERSLSLPTDPPKTVPLRNAWQYVRFLTAAGSVKTYHLLLALQRRHAFVAERYVVARILERRLDDVGEARLLHRLRH
jgi:hypothetical protein